VDEGLEVLACGAFVRHEDAFVLHDVGDVLDEDAFVLHDVGGVLDEDALVLRDVGGILDDGVAARDEAPFGVAAAGSPVFVAA